MTTEELLSELYDQTLVGNKPAVLELTNAGLAQGLGPETLLYEALIPSLEEVGARFERGDFFVPEMLIAGKAMAGALEILRPLLAETGAQTIGKIVMGTVKGDVHDIGKNLVNIMFEGAGFEVIDLGVQVAPEKFVAAIAGAQAGHRGLLRVPHHDHADVQGQHQRAEQGRPARPGDRDGRRRPGHPGVRRRGGRGRVRRRRLGRRGPGQGTARAAPRAPVSTALQPSRARSQRAQPAEGEPARAHHPVLGDQDGADRRRPAVRDHRRADQPDRPEDLPAAAARR